MDQSSADAELHDCHTCKTLQERQQADNHRKRLEELTHELTVKETQIQHYIRKELKNRSQQESLHAKNAKLSSAYDQLCKEYESLLEVLKSVETENAELKEQLIGMQRKDTRQREIHQQEEMLRIKKQAREVPDEHHLELLQANLKQLTNRNRELVEQLHLSEEKIQVLRSDMKDLLIRKAEGDRVNERASKFTLAVQKALQNLNILEPEEHLDVKRNWRLLKDLMKRASIGYAIGAFNHSLDCSKESPYASRSVGRITRYRSN